MSLIGFIPKKCHRKSSTRLTGYPTVMQKKIRAVDESKVGPLSMLELAARTIVANKIKVNPGDIPSNLESLIKSGFKCINPDCNRVYFDGRRSPFKEYLIVQFLCADCETKKDRIAAKYPKCLKMRHAILHGLWE